MKEWRQVTSRFTPGRKISGTHSIVRWVGASADMDDLEKRGKKKSLSPAVNRTTIPWV
jgi:hypothetical protein